MCDTNSLLRLSQSVAQGEWELHRAARELIEHSPNSWRSSVHAARKALEERGDVGAIKVLDRVVAVEANRDTVPQVTSEGIKRTPLTPPRFNKDGHMLLGEEALR